MAIYTRLLLIAIIASVLIGCQAGQYAAPPPEIQLDEVPGPFIFAESSFLNIDSDMMAEQFHINRLPAAFTDIDSNTALDAVYQMLMDSLLADESKSHDLRTMPQLYRQYMQLRYERVMQLMYTHLMVDSASASDSAVAAEYELSKEEYKIPEQFRARHIVISYQGLMKSDDSVLYKDYSKDELDSIAHVMITDVHRRAVAGEDFDTLAMRYSLDPGSADSGGDLGMFQLASMVNPFDSTVEHTPVGEISGVIKTVFGWHIVKVEDHFPEHYLGVDSARTQLELKVKQKQMMEKSITFVDSIKSVGTIVYDTAAIMLDDSQHDNNDPLAYINSEDTEFGNDTMYYRDYAEQVYSYRKMRRLEGALSFNDKLILINTIAVRFHLLRASRTLGYYTDPEIEEWASQVETKYITSTLRKRLMNDQYSPSDEEIKNYYEENIDQYNIDRPIYVQHIIFADSNMAEHIRDQLYSGLDFMETALEYYPGDPDIREAASDLGHIGPRDMPQPFWQAARQTQVGEISKPVKTEFGYHLVKVIEKKYSVSLEKATLKIKPKLIARHKDRVRREYVEARLDAPPKIHWEKLGELYRKDLPPPTFAGQR